MAEDIHDFTLADRQKNPLVVDCAASFYISEEMIHESPLFECIQIMIFCIPTFPVFCFFFSFFFSKCSPK